MKEYSYKDIQKVTEAGIVFRDGFELSFEECKNGWCAERKIKREQSCCVAERDCLARIPYFLFYSQRKVKVLFDKKGIMSKRKNEKDFHSLQFLLNELGFTSYDLT